MKKVVLLFICMLLLTGCKTKNYEYKTASFEEIEKLAATNNYQVIDVRSESEYLAGHYTNAINIEYNKINTITISKDTIIFVYCASGYRSKIAAQSLLQMGYLVYDLGAYKNLE